MKHLKPLLKFVKPYWKQSTLALTLLTVVIVMELALPRLIQQIIDRGIAENDLPVIIDTTLIMLGLTVLSAFFAVYYNYLSVWVGENFARDLRAAMYLHIQKFSFGNLDHLRTGQLIVRLTSDVSVLQRAVRMLLRIGTRAPLLMIGSLIMMVVTNRELALAILPVMLITAGIIVFFVAKVGTLYLTVQKRLDALNNVLQENISGVRVIKAFVRARHEGERFEKANTDFTDETVRVMQIMASLFPSMTMMLNIGIVIVIWNGGIQTIRGDFTLGEIVAFINYLLTTMSPLMIMAMVSQVLASAFASAERINEVLHTMPEIEDLPDAPALPENIAGRICFENVKFYYNGATSETVLEDINLTAEPGQTVAILGATGSGKTSLVNLIPRFYDVADGRVTIDGIDVRTVKQDSIIANVGMVPQESVLFSGSVKDNIRYGLPEASDEEIIAAAQAAQAHEFILELPDGYDTHIEQRGVNLSGGQKQRIAIARALLTKPKILILDDSTSSVDVETETKIQQALETLMQGRTSFVIAQRISTVLNADKIVVIDKGKIAAEGTHQELLTSSKIYKEIYDSQLGNGVPSLPARIGGQA